LQAVGATPLTENLTSYMGRAAMFAVYSDVIHCYLIMPNNEAEILHSNRDSTKTTASYPQWDGKSESASVVMLCGCGVKAGMVHSTCG